MQLENHSWIARFTRLQINETSLIQSYVCCLQGYFGMSSTEELEMAIETCKELILLAPPNSDKHKNLVKKLIQLRLKLQELKVPLCLAITDP